MNGHILPRFGFKRVRDRRPGRKPDPISVSRTSTIRTSEQYTDQLLCAECEHRIKVGGEDYTAKVAFQENGDSEMFRLVGYRSAVNSLPWPSPAVPVAATALDIERLTYFALSVIWRASVCSVPEFTGYKLQDVDEESIRSFLLSGTPYSPSVTVMLVVLDQARGMTRRFDQAMTFPVMETQSPGFEKHVFQINGLFFRVGIGPAVPQTLLDMDLRRRSPPVVVFAAANHIAEVGAMRDVVATSPVRGSLARDRE